MWEGILSGIILSIGEAVCINKIKAEKSKKIIRKLNNLIETTFNKYADSTLDCDNFYRVVTNSKFSELLHKFFWISYDRKGILEYEDYLTKYILSEVPTAKSFEVSSFINDINEVYVCFLGKIIEEEPAINSLIQILSVSQRILLDRISESEETFLKYVQSLSEDNTISDKTINKFHDVSSKEFSKIRFTGISGEEMKGEQNINNFYVRNNFSYYFPKTMTNLYQNNVSDILPIDIENIFRDGNKIVIVGGAGFGKTTTLNYIYCNYEKLFNQHPLKIKIDLKDYTEKITNDSKDILWCISNEFYKKTPREMDLKNTEKTLSKYLLDGKCFVIFDALDEIPSLYQRNKVRDMIANFCDIYYLNRFIISTREVGYLKNKFDKSFIHFRINEFDPPRIKEYSTNWFKAYYDETSFEDFWTSFNIEVQKSNCSTLIKNPIILVLALSIFDIETNLPNKRVEFYQKCIDTFLKVREDRKAARKLSREAKNILGIDTLMPDIAFFKYDKRIEDSDYKFTYDELKEGIFSSLDVTDKINWNSPVEECAEYIVERTELIREFDEDTFDFSHKTFFEFFLALYYSKHFDNEELFDKISSWIGDSNNDELAKLVIEIVIQKGNTSQNKYVMNKLFESANSDKFSNRIEFFRIIADLYSNGMLHPRYHISYYNMLLLNGDVFYILSHRRNLLSDDYFEIKYDEKILSNVFCEISNDYEKYFKSFYSLNCVNNKAKREIINQKANDEIANVFSLFSYKTNKKRPNPNIKSTIDYFTNKNLTLTLSHPLIYVFTLKAVLESNSYESLPLLANVTFKENTDFFQYSTTKDMLRLLDYLITSKSGIEILLIALIICSSGSTNIIFGWAMEHFSELDFDGQSNDMLDFVNWLFDLLYASSSDVEFIEELKSKEFYNEQYNDLYKSVYCSYRQNGRDKYDDRIPDMSK